MSDGPKHDPLKEYLGDGAYAHFDGYHFILTAENGVIATNTIYLDPHAVIALLDFVQRTSKELRR